MQVSPVFLPGESHGEEPSRVHGSQESDMTQQLNHCHQGLSQDRDAGGERGKGPDGGEGL